MHMMVYLAGALGIAVGDLAKMRTDCLRYCYKSWVMVPCINRIKVRPGRRSPPEAGVIATQETIDKIRKHIKTLPRGSRYLFPKPKKDEPQQNQTIIKYWRLLIKGLGFDENFSFHSLRNYRGVTLWKATKDIHYLKREMRIKERVKAEKYEKLAKDFIRWEKENAGGKRKG